MLIIVKKITLLDFFVVSANVERIDCSVVIRFRTIVIRQNMDPPRGSLRTSVIFVSKLEK